MEILEISLPSGLFPFHLADLPRFNYGGYRLENVFRSASPAQQRECVALWLRHGVIASPKAAWERSGEICYLMRATDGGRLVGVNTLYPGRLEDGGPRCFLYRLFIAPQRRNSRLMIVATAATLCYGATRLAAEGLPGILTIADNPKLARPGMRRILSRLGYRWRDRRNGRDVWYFDFASARFIDGA